MIKTLSRCTLISFIITFSNLQPTPAIALNSSSITDKSSIKYYEFIPVLTLSGDNKEMGKKYGMMLKYQLHQALKILRRFYFEKGISFAAMVKQADLLYNRFPSNYQTFIQEEAKGANLTLDEAKVLNAMETMGELLHTQDVMCAFLYVSPNKTKTGSALIGRNYDYPPPFDQLSKYLTVTILKRTKTTPTAFISIAGEIYCPTCVNAKGIFMELNNGTSSGGHYVDTKKKSLLSRMLTTLEKANTMKDVEKEMDKKSADFSLIINSADKDHVESFEYSTTLGMKTFYPQKNILFASTNYYLNPEWGMQIPIPTDDKTWFGVTRRKNLLNFDNTENLFDVASLEKQMDKKIAEGGAAWDLTIYQIIFDENDYSLYIKILANGPTWTRVPLGKLFSNNY